MAGLGLRHPPQDVGLALVQALRDQLVDSPREDLATPRRQQPLADGGVGLGALVRGRDDVDFTAAGGATSLGPG
jgi:hypothetical protein